AVYLATLVFAGGGAALAAFAARLTASAPGQVAIVAAALGAGHALLGLPLAWVSSWVLPRRYGLLHQPLSGWLADRAKAAALGAAADAREPRRRARHRRVDRRPVAQEPHGERRGRRARPHAAHPALRHARHRLPPRGDRGRARARAGAPRPRRRASRPRRAG